MAKFRSAKTLLRQKGPRTNHLPPKHGLEDGWHPAFAEGPNGELKILIAVVKDGKGLMLTMDPPEAQQMIECLQMGLRRDSGKDIVVQ